MMPDSDLRQALLGTWRLVSFQVEVDGTVVKPFGDDPHGYLVYTPDEQVFVQFTTRAERSWPGPEVLEMSRPKAAAALGFWAYCGTFEVRDGQAIHQMEFGIFPSLSGRREPRSIMLDGDRLILGTPLSGQFEWQRVHAEQPAMSEMPDSVLRQALFGTWRLISFQIDVDGTLVKPVGDDPVGYLVYTRDAHVLAQFATGGERNWPGPEVLKLQPHQRMAALAFNAYCGTFDVRDGEVIHHREFGIYPTMSGTVEPRSVALHGDRLFLNSPGGGQLEWQRVQ